MLLKSGTVKALVLLDFFHGIRGLLLLGGHMLCVGVYCRDERGTGVETEGKVCANFQYYLSQ
jgi:hypothetical protein